MYERLSEGYDVVYAKRRSREKTEYRIKRIISRFGYALINKLGEVEIPRDAGDFRIITRRVIEELRKLGESHGFLRGLVAFVGFKQTFVEYDRHDRFSGRGKYSAYTGSIKIGLNGLIGFSARPLFLMSMFGTVLAFASFLVGSIYALLKLSGVEFSAGLTTIVLFITFFSGVNLLALGLVGEYVGRIYDEVKRRPMYIIDKEIKRSRGD